MSKRREYELSFRLKTHCEGCGLALMCEAIQLLPNADYMRMTMEKVRGQLDRAVCPKCSQKVPVLPTEWVEVWDGI